MNSKRYILFLILLYPIIAWGQCETVRIFPYSEDCEDTTVNCWFIGEMDGDSITWGWYNDPDNNNNHLFASISTYEYGYAQMANINTDNWLASPWFALPQNAKKITLRYYAKGSNDQHCKDIYSIHVSNIEDFDETSPDTTGEITNNFERYTFDLTPWRGETIHFAIRHRVESGDMGYDILYLAFDNFEIDVECDTVKKDTVVRTTKYITQDSKEIYNDTTLYWTTNNIQEMCNDTIYKTDIIIISPDNYIVLNDTTITACDSATYRMRHYYNDTTFIDSTINAMGEIEIQKAEIHITPSTNEYKIQQLTVFPQYRWRDGSRIVKDTIIGDTIHLGICKDSIYQTIITFIPDTIRLVDTNIYACDTAYYNSKYYLTNKSYTDTSYNDTGSIVLQHVNIEVYSSYAYNDSIYIDTCDYYLWQGLTLKLPGTYIADYTTSDTAKCDSIYYLKLVLPLAKLPDTVRYHIDSTVCGILKWNKHLIYHDTTIYDSLHTEDTIYITITSFIITPTKIIEQDTTINGKIYETYVYNGDIYQRNDDIPEVQGNCDSVILVHLNVICGVTTGPTVDTVGCDNITWHGITYRYIENERTDYRIEDTIENHCGMDSLRQIHIFLRPTYFYTDTFTERQHGVYRWHNKVLNRSGKYQKMYQSQWGCDSIYEIRIRFVDPNCATTYHYEDTATCDSMLYNNTMFYYDTNHTVKLVNAEGCDSMYITRITIHTSYHNNRDTSACDMIRWQMQNITADTVLKLYTGHSVQNCDSTETLTITIGKISNIRDTVEGCDSYKYRNVVYTQSGDDIFNSTDTSTGCDSTIYVHVNIRHSSRYDSIINRCDSARVLDSLHLASTILSMRDTAANGCDSMTYIHVNIYQPEIHDSNVTACDFYTYNHDTTFYRNVDYIDTLDGTSHGCLKVERLHLTLFYSDTIKIDSLACDAIEWYANRFDHDTVARFVHTNHHHCDSTEILYLRIRKNSRSERGIIACDSYRWFDSTYTTSTDAYRHIKNSEGCDSAMTAHIKIYHNDTIDTTIYSCDKLLWHDSTYHSSTIDTFFFNIHTCHYAEVMHLTIGTDTNTQHQVNACDSMTWGKDIYRHDTTIVLHKHTIAGCDSTATVTLTVYHSTYSTINISDCDSHTWHGTTYYASTNTPTHTRTNIYGCDSTLTLNLTLYHSGIYTDTLHGCDSLVYDNTTYTHEQRIIKPRHLTAHGCDSIPAIQIILHHQNDTTPYTITSCDQYTWHNNTYTTDTIAAIDSIDQYSCQHSLQLILTLHRSDNTQQYITKCDSAKWDDSTYTSSTTIIYDTTNAYGCDSTSSIHLLINNSIADTIDTAVCSMLSIFGKTISSETTNRLLILQTKDGCDSTLLLTLHILNNKSDTTITGCDKIKWKNKTYISNDIQIDTLVNAAHCDSLVITHINVGHTATTIEQLHGCDSFIWRDSVWRYTNTTATDTVRHAGQCDTIYILTLRLDTNKHNEFEITANRIVEWNGMQYDSTGYYTQAIPIANGCDSIVTMHLRYSNLPTPQIMSHDGVILMVNHYINGDMGHRTDYPAYQWYRNGDSIPYATKDQYNDHYQPLDGCYYVMVAIDDTCSGWLKSNLECFDNGQHEGIEQPIPSQIEIHPNPIRQGDKIHVNGIATTAQITIYNSIGQRIGTPQICHGNTTLSAPHTPGEYLLLITTPNATMLHKIIIQ